MLKRIEEASLSGANELNLQNLGLTDIPSEIESLHQLRVLRLDNNCSTREDSYDDNFEPFNKIVHLSPIIGKLVNLEELYLDGIGLESLPEEIGHLDKLRVLSIGKATRSWYQYGSGEDRERYHSNELQSLPQIHR